MNQVATSQEEPLKLRLTKPGGQRYVRRRTISKTFRAILAEYLPNLDKRRAYWEFVGYLLFGCQFDENTDRLMLWKETLAEITGSDLHNFSAIKFLEEFQRDVMSPDAFQWHEYNHLGGRCRQVKRCVWPAAIQLALSQELLNHWHDQGRVYLDGSAFSKAKVRIERSEQQSAAKTPRALHTDAIMIQRYMNSRAPNLFTATVANYFESALSAANKLPVSRTRMAQLRILKSIHEQPKPIYAASRRGNTARLVTSEHIPNLQKTVRWALTPEWSEADLRCSQLAICAWQWNVPCVLKFLATGGSLWEYLCRKVGVPSQHFEEAKKTLKKAVYATCYGMPRSHVQGLVTRRMNRIGIKGCGLRFVQDELIAALIEAREGEILKINAKGGALDCYGHWIPTDGGRKEEGILAELAQAWEMKLIAPIFQLAQHTKGFQVLLYQFDGVSIHFFRDKDRWQEGISDMVSAKARELGINTGLEWKDSTTYKDYH